MNNNNINNNQSGNNSTTFNANKNSYNAQKNEAFSKGQNVKNGLNKESDKLDKKASNINPLSKVGMNATSKFDNQQNIQNSSQDINESSNELENNTQNNGGFGSRLKNGLGLGSSISNAGGKAGNIVAKIKKIPPFVWPIIGWIALISTIIILIIILVGYFIELGTAAIDEAFSKGETAINFIAGDGFNNNVEAIRKRIDQAANECEDCIISGSISGNKGLDKGILYATINNEALITSDVYDAQSEIKQGDDGYKEIDNESADNLIVDFLIDRYSSHAFYAMKLDLLGGTGEAGSMIYSLMGQEFDYECVDERDYSSFDNKKAYAEYAFNTIIKGLDMSVTNAKNWTFIALKLPKLIDQIASYANQVSGPEDKWYEYIWKGISEKGDKELSEIVFTIEENVIRDAIGEVIKLKEFEETCDNMKPIQVKENGVTKSYKYKAQYSVKKINDYNRYYKYISKIYVPVIYASVWSDYSKEEKNKTIKSVWRDIVNARNDYYSINGETNYLSYYFDDYGNLVTYVTSGSGFGYFYVSDIPVGTTGTGWKQTDSRWSKIVLGTDYSPKCTGGKKTMGCIGCYVTSIATLMANSGTQINSDTFDPGVLARVMLENNSFNSSGSAVAHNWSSLAPNFKYHTGEFNLQYKSKSEIASIISNYLNQGYYVIIQVKSGGHFVAVIGAQEGHILISDPQGNINTPALFDDNELYPEGTINSIRVFIA